MTNSIIKNLDRIILFLVKATIFLLPLFFLPWTKEFFEFNKQYLLWLIVPLILFLWLAKVIINGQLVIRKTLLDAPLLFFLIAGFISALFSLDRFSSIFGYFGRSSDAWLGFLSLVFFYFISVNWLADLNQIKSTIKILIYSSGLANLIGLFSILGVWSKIFAGHNAFTSDFFNPTAGSLNSLAIFCSIICLVITGYLNYQPKEKIRLLFYTWLFISLLVMLLIGFNTAWLVLTIGSIFQLVFLIIFRKKFKPLAEEQNNWPDKIYFFSRRQFILPIIIIFLSLIFTLWPNLNFQKRILGKSLSQEVALNFSQSQSLSLSALKGNLLTGSGLGTFAYDFSLYRQPEMNASSFWQFRFDKAFSQIEEMLATGGLLLFGTYLLLIGLFIYLNVTNLKKFIAPGDKLKPANLYLAISIFCSFLAALTSQFFYQTNTVIWFLLFLFLSLDMAFWAAVNMPVVQTVEFNKVRLVGYKKILPAVLILFFAGWLVLVGFEIKYYVADVFFATGQADEAKLLKAVTLNPQRINYQINLAKYYLNQVRILSLDNAVGKNTESIQNNMEQGINWAKSAVDTNPKSVLAWETLGMVYRDIRLLSSGSEPWAVKAFSEALKLEPTNPVLSTELARVYMYNNETEQAENYFLRAMELKKDYYQAYFGLAALYTKVKKDKQALAILNQLSENLSDPEIYYEQGRLLYNDGQIDLAIKNFLEVLKIMPNHANALYSLALAYETKGEKTEALKYFKKVLELNPGDQALIERIKSLE